MIKRAERARLYVYTSLQYIIYRINVFFGNSIVHKHVRPSVGCDGVVRYCGGEVFFAVVVVVVVVCRSEKTKRPVAVASASERKKSDKDNMRKKCIYTENVK